MTNQRQQGEPEIRTLYLVVWAENDHGNTVWQTQPYNTQGEAEESLELTKEDQETDNVFIRTVQVPTMKF